MSGIEGASRISSVFGLNVRPRTQIVLPRRLPPKAEDTLRAMDLTDPASGYMGWLEVPGGNGCNVHGHLTPLALGPELIHDEKAREKAARIVKKVKGVISVDNKLKLLSET